MLRCGRSPGIVNRKGKLVLCGCNLQVESIRSTCLQGKSTRANSMFLGTRAIHNRRAVDSGVTILIVLSYVRYATFFALLAARCRALGEYSTVACLAVHAHLSGYLKPEAFQGSGVMPRGHFPGWVLCCGFAGHKTAIRSKSLIVHLCVGILSALESKQMVSCDKKAYNRSKRWTHGPKSRAVLVGSQAL